MSLPSTTSYFPLDSDAPQTFSEIQTDNYVYSECWLSHPIISSFQLCLMCSRIPCIGRFNTNLDSKTDIMGSCQMLLVYDHVITLDKEV